MLARYSEADSVVKNKPMANVQNATAAMRAGKILNTLAQTNAKMLFLPKKLPAIRKPLVIKNISTAMVPNVIPIEFLRGSASPLPVTSAKLWEYKTSDAAINRIKLKLLSRLFVYFDKTVFMYMPLNLLLNQVVISIVKKTDEHSVRYFQY